VQSPKENIKERIAYPALLSSLLKFYKAIRDKMFQCKKYTLEEPIVNYFHTPDDQITVFLHESPVEFVKIIQSLLIWHLQTEALQGNSSQNKNKNIPRAKTLRMRRTNIPESKENQQ
jgi:hypothetical protein